MLTRKTLIFLLLSLTYTNLKAQQNKPDEKMGWFADAKLGIFIHWGIYAVNGVSESWSFYNNYLNHDAYLQQLNGFSALKYNPQEWVKLIKESGAKYAVITTKHHDGVALWDSKAAGATTTVKNSASKKDLITPFVNNLKMAGLKTGLYFSLPDWSYPDYDIFTREKKRYDFKRNQKRWNTFLNYYQTQLKELSNQFKPDLLWFDGDWEHTADEWQTEKVSTLLKSENPHIIINSRLDKHGDYETPEQGVPVVRPASKYWELCYTMNDSWGFQPYDQHYKSSNIIIRTLVDCISMGGNLLLDIGPKADGTIAPEQVQILKDLGRWTNKYAEAIYETQAGIPERHFAGKTSLSKDRKTLFLYIDYKTNQGIRLKGIKSNVKSMQLIGGKAVKYTKIDDLEYLLNVSPNDSDQDVTVVKVNFEAPIILAEAGNENISIEDLFNVHTKLDLSTYKLQKLSSVLDKGKNIFNTTNLTADGMNFNAQVKPLDQKVHNWVSKHAEALHKTIAGIPEGHYPGKTVLSADKQTLYLFVEGQPTGPIAIKGLENNISRIRIVGEGTMLNHEVYNKLYWSKVPGIVYIDIPKDKLDDRLTVIAVLLDGPIKLYRENISAIESNL